MSPALPQFLNPWQALKTQAQFAGAVPLSAFSRLRSELVDLEGRLDYGLRFQRDEEKRGLILGWVSGRLRLTCQRCLQPMDYGVRCSVALALVSGIEEAKRLPEAYDPLLVEDAPMRSILLLEDELLLALPQIPRHPEGACRPPVSTELPREKHPFAALADWKP